MTTPNTQLALRLNDAHTPAPDPADVESLCSFLRGRNWVRAATISAELGARRTERFIRAVATASDGRVLSFPGSPGYRLLREASLEEISRGVNTLRSQAAAMLQRAARLDLRARRREIS